MIAPLYDINKSYAENAEQGPFFSEKIPERRWAPREKWLDCLGIPLASPLGVPAGPLLNSRWIALAAKLGYDLLTYKTIRSRPSSGHGLPNILHVETHGQIGEKQFEGVLYPVEKPSSNLEEIAITNSFGMPSKGRDFLLKDIAVAQESLSPGQAMIVSVVGTPCQGCDFIADFVEAAAIARDAGAKLIEANFSCPNVTSGEGSLYDSPKAVEEISRALVQAIGPIPLIIKMGTLIHPELMRDVLLAAARSGVRGICGINTIKMQVLDRNGLPALGEGRRFSGICGAPIRSVGLDFVRKARRLIDQERLDLTLIGVGGITRPEHVDDYLAAGAEFAQTATGMMWDPYLAEKYHNGH